MLRTHHLTIWTPPQPNVKLRSITEDDIELLRVWKNAHRYSFFFQEIIEPEQQRWWFEQFCTREHDYMFIVQYDDVDVGCMGFRLLNDRIDIYNVILGRKEHSGKGTMSIAVCLMNGFIVDKFTEDITAKVLRSNPALEWYLKNGFEVVETFDTYYLIRLTKRSCRYEIRYRLFEK